MATSPKASAKSKSKETAGKPADKKAVSKRSSPTKKAAVKATKPKTRSRKSVPSKSTSKSTTAKKAPTAKKATTKKAVATKKAAVTKKAAARKPPAKKVVKSKLPKKFVGEMKVRLLEERAKYLQTAEDMRAEADSLFADREPGDVQFDEESGEGDTLAVERERGLALSTQAQSAVQQIDEALARITAGTYGICIVSSEPIPKERLEAIPWAAMTVKHKVGGLSRR